MLKKKKKKKKQVKYVVVVFIFRRFYISLVYFQCHLATLLKTAEELRIKGLAEVSWRDEDQQPGNSDSNSNGVQTAIPQVQAVMDSPTTKFDSPSNKRKRGRPPIDDYDQTFTTPRIMNVTGGTQEDAYSNDAMSSSEHDLNIWEEEQSANEATENTENEEPPVKVKKEVVGIMYYQ